MSPPPSAPTGPDSARERLLQAGLRLFAQQGYAKTSTRELAEAAQVNVAAISYYFNDKAGLYRAALIGPAGPTAEQLAHLGDPSRSLREFLQAFYAGFVAPLSEGDAARLCVKLHFREMLEPTGLCDDLVDHEIRPQHDLLVAVLQRHLGLAEPDDELQGLSVCLAALGVHLHVGRDHCEQLAPELIHHPEALARWSERLVRFGLAMVESERARRGLPPATSP